MKIERIELNGFKSFSGRTVFKMHPGITCIVGPNGCGKSNVVDAFKWVLGEQSARHLRGDKMEEIIFNGTRVKKPTGMAEVSLHLTDVKRDAAGFDAAESGDDGGSDDGNETAVSRGGAQGAEKETENDSFDGDPDGNPDGNPSDSLSAPSASPRETSVLSPDAASTRIASASGENSRALVTRRLYRSGESEYYIDKKRSRLKDLRDLFLDTGLEVKSYSFIEQGRIDAVLSAKPVDRRFLIEEVAGVMKYKVRRNEALQKLDHSSINLNRVNDIISEVRRTINSLDRQVKKAERFKALTLELNTIELKIFKRDYEAFSGENETLGADISERTARTDALSEGLAGREDFIAEKRAWIHQREKILEALNDTRNTLQQALSEILKDAAVRRKEIENVDSHVERMRAGLAEYAMESDEICQKALELEEAERALSESAAALEKSCEAQKAEIDAIERGFAGVESDLKERHRRLFKLSETCGDLSGEISRIHSNIASMHRKIDSSRGAAAGAAEDVKRIEADILRMERDLHEMHREIAVNNERKAALDADIADTERAVDTLRGEVSRFREEAAADRARLKSLEEVVSGGLDIEALKQRVAVLTLLSDVLDVPPRYETAVENALAEKINCYVLGDIEGVKRAAAYMKEGAHDRTAFTSADLAAAPPSPPLAASLAPSHAASHAAPLAASLAASHAAPLEEATPGQGSAIRMSAVVSVRGPYAGIVNAALDEFIIATDLDHALDIRARLAAHAALSLSFSAPSASPRETSVLPLGQSSGQDAGRDAGQDAVPFAPSAPPRETSVLPLGQSSGRDAAQSSAQPSAPSGIVVRPRIVTLEGDVVEPSGMVVTGKKGGVLKHVRQIRELKDKLARRGDGIGRLEKDLSARIAEKEDRRREAKGVSELVFKLEKDLSVSKLNISRQVEDKEKTQKKLYYLKVESEGFLKEIASFQTMLAEKEQYLKDLTVKKEETDRHIQEIRDGITEKRARADVVRHSLTEKKMSAANDRERQRAAAAERAAALRKFNSLSAKTASVENEIEALGIKEKAWAAEILVKEEEALVIKDKLLKAAEDTQREKEGLERENAALLAAEREITALRHEIDSLRKRTGELEVRQAEVRLRMENIHTAVSNNYGRDIREVETPHPLPPLLPHPLPPLLKERGLGGEAGGEAESEEERLGLLRRKIQDIGPVNLASIEEYRELKTRYDFLDTQRNDLSKSIEELQQAISRINYTTRQRLGDAFSNLNLRFNETFKLFFGGGSARLILTDSDNILESGIDIEVQPPEKKLQNINLLSGGEKTLTAISLIFAGFLLKPTPLCIMDEADAALDESNTRRFTNMIKTLAMNTQFILITHNRITMEIADYIYGITNEEPGVSKVISVQFAEA